MQKKKGKLYGVGVGPGDPELLTLKAINVIKNSKLIVYHQTKTKNSQALKIIKPFIENHHEFLGLTYPITKEKVSDKDYKENLEIFYQNTIETLKMYLEAGKDLCLITEGDPSIYSSFSHLLMRLPSYYDIEIIPGISSFLAGAAVLKTPLCLKDQCLTLLPGNLPIETLSKHLNRKDNFVIFKMSQNWQKLSLLLKERNLWEKSYYIEYITQEQQKISLLKHFVKEEIPYFSLIMIPNDGEL